MKNIFKSHGIQKSIFIKYLIIFSVLIISFILITAIYFMDISLANEKETLQATAKMISFKFDSQVKDMDAVLEQIMFDETIHSLFFDQLSDWKLRKKRDQLRFELTKKLNSLIIPHMQVESISIFDENGKSVNVGFAEKAGSTATKNQETFPWFNDVINRFGDKMIVPAHTDSIGFEPRDVFSLCRSFKYVRKSAPATIAEVQKPYYSINNLVAETIIGDEYWHDSIYIVNDHLEFVYPFSVSQPEADKLRAFFEQTPYTNAPIGTLDLTYDRNDSYACSYYYSSYTDYYVIIISQQSSLLAPLYLVILNFILIGVCALIATLLVSFFIAKRITDPIKRLQDAMQSLTINNISTFDPIVFSSRDSDEIKQLGASFWSMSQNLQSSMKRTVIAKTHAMQSSILALQSQMNPHFLYNIITHISTIAEDENNLHIQSICLDLSNILRYVLSPTVETTICGDITCALQYINLMKVRYESKLDFSFDVDPAAYDIVIPKMIIQPLIENAIKYGLSEKPIWMIQVSVTLSGENWQLCIQDNGNGFSHEVLKQLYDKFEHFDPEASLLTLYDTNIGLINIFARMHLFYNGNMQFEIKNNEIGGCVIIGAQIHKAAETEK